jgi:hypothetical protein
MGTSLGRIVMAETAISQTHAHKSCEGCCFKETTIGRLHAQQHTHGFGNEESANRRQNTTTFV